MNRQALFRFGRASARHLRRRAEWYLAPLFYTALVAVIFRQLWEGKVGIGWDLIESYWADLSFVARQFRRGDFPLWNPYERGGVPAIADPQPAVMYPVQWLFALWGALWGEVSWTLIQVKELSHHALGGTMMYLFLRTRRLPWQAALVGGVVTILGGPWFINKSNNYLYPLAWVPLVWVAMDALLARPGWRRGVALAGALYLPASAGSPPGYFFALLMIFAYGVFRVTPWLVRHGLDARSGRPTAPDARAQLVRFAGAFGLAVLLAVCTQLILMLPTRDLLALSPRANRTIDFALSGECGMGALMRGFVGPNEAWYGSNFGFAALVLSACALFLPGWRTRAHAAFFVTLAVFFTSLSVGRQLPVMPWVAAHLPGFELFRICCRYMLLTGMGLGAAAGFGMAGFLAAPRRWRGLVIALVVSAIWAWVAYSVFQSDANASKAPLYPFRPFGIVAVSALLIIAVAVSRGRLQQTLAAAVPLLIAFDVSQVYLRVPGFQPRPDGLAEDRAKLAGLGDLRPHRIWDEFLLEQRSGSRMGLREMRGYTSGDPLTRLDIGELMAVALTKPQVLPEYNVKYVFHGPHSTKGWDKTLMRGPPDALAPKHFRKVRPVVYEALHPAPQAAWYGELRVTPAPAIWGVLADARDGAGVRRFATVTPEEVARVGLEAAMTPLARPTAHASVSGRMVRFGTDVIRFEIDAPAPGVVVLNEAHFPGWRVRVDGRPAQDFSVDRFLRGVLVTAGTHRIEWVFTPRHWWPLLGAWLLGVIVIAAAGGTLVRDRWRARRVSPLPGSTAAS